MENKLGENKEQHIGKKEFDELSEQVDGKKDSNYIMEKEVK